MCRRDSSRSRRAPCGPGGPARATLAPAAVRRRPARRIRSLVMTRRSYLAPTAVGLGRICLPRSGEVGRAAAGWEITSGPISPPHAVREITMRISPPHAVGRSRVPHLASHALGRSARAARRVGDHECPSPPTQWGGRRAAAGWGHHECPSRLPTQWEVGARSAPGGRSRVPRAARE